MADRLEDVGAAALMAIPRSWRISEAEDGRGLLCYFDPFLEDVTIRHLTAPERASRLDKVASVSALIEVEVDSAYDPDHNSLFEQSSLFDPSKEVK